MTLLGDCHEEDVIRPTYSLCLTIIYFLRSSFVFLVNAGP